ncbi:MAG TPA: hypothetical protein VN081_04925 [Dongiaceae bacterium]|nr:hypothetical protein [Dongiaceae bacterium]
MTLLTLHHTHPVDHSADEEIKLLFEHLKADFAKPEVAHAVKALFGFLDQLKHRADIKPMPGRRWNAYKAADSKATSLLESIVRVFKDLNGRVHGEEREHLIELLKLEGVLIGRKGQDGYGRTLYCLHTTKGSIPLDQPLGITHYALLQRQRTQRTQA